MRRQAALVCLAVLAVLLPSSGASADEPKIEESSPIAQLRAIGFPFECHKLHELGSVDSRDETDPDEVEYINLGDSQVAIIVVSGVPDDARTSLRYYFPMG